MSRRTIFTVLASLATLLFITSAQAAEPENLRLVQLNKGLKGKLHASLVATLDADGVLKGNDASGQPIIDVAAGNEKKLEDSKAVKSVSTTIPKKWSPVEQLRISYGATRPTDQELKDAGLELIEDYKRGSFLIVKPAKGKTIDATLIKSLDKCANVLRVTPSFKLFALN